MRNRLSGIAIYERHRKNWCCQVKVGGLYMDTIHVGNGVRFPRKISKTVGQTAASRLPSRGRNSTGAVNYGFDLTAPRPHITIQNKAEPQEARLLLEQLQLEFEPFHIVVEGLLLWRYLVGPWELIDRVAFNAP